MKYLTTYYTYTTKVFSPNLAVKNSYLIGKSAIHTFIGNKYNKLIELECRVDGKHLLAKINVID